MSNNFIQLFHNAMFKKNKRLIIVCWYENDVDRQYHNCITAAQRCFEEKGYTVAQYGLLKAKNEKRDYIIDFDSFINSFAPSIILFWNWGTIDQSDIEMIKMNHADKVFMIFNWNDPHCWLKPVPKMKYFDISLSTCLGTLSNYTNSGVSLSKYLLPGFSPSSHFHEIDSTYMCDVSFMCTNLFASGSTDRDDKILVDRTSMIQALDKDPRFKFRLYGPEHLKPCAQRSYRFEVPYEKNRLVFSNSKININVHGAYGEGYLNERTFTILGSGGLLLIDNIPGLDRVLTPGVNCVVIRDTNPKKICDQVNEILMNYADYYPIRMAGLELANRYYTYDVWVDKVLDAYAEYMCSPESVGKYCSYYNTLNDVVDIRYPVLTTPISSPTPLVIGILIDFSDKELSPINLLHFRNKISAEAPSSTVGWAIRTNTIDRSEEYVMHMFGLIRYFIDRYDDSVGLGFGFMNHNLSMDFMKQCVNYLDTKYSKYINLEVPVLNGPVNSRKNDYFKSIPKKYRPKFIMSYSINQEQIEWIRDNLDITVFMSWTATQTNVDGFSGEGTILSPYYPHKLNPMVPAQKMEDSNGCLIFNTITVDPIGCRYLDGESRWTIHPADPLTDGAEQILLIKRYLTNPLRTGNNTNYFSIFFDASWIFTDLKLKNAWESIMNYILQPHINIVMNSPDLFGHDFMAKHKNNDDINFMLDFRGTNLTKAGHSSMYDTRYVWTETKEHRIIFDVDKNNRYRVIDFTDYVDCTKKLEKSPAINYITGRNFKYFPKKQMTDSEKIRAKTVFNNVMTRSADKISADLVF